MAFIHYAFFLIHFQHKSNHKFIKTRLIYFQGTLKFVIIIFVLSYFIFCYLSAQSTNSTQVIQDCRPAVSHNGVVMRVAHVMNLGGELSTVVLNQEKAKPALCFELLKASSKYCPDIICYYTQQTCRSLTGISSLHLRHASQTQLKNLYLRFFVVFPIYQNYRF